MYYLLLIIFLSFNINSIYADDHKQTYEIFHVTKESLNVLDDANESQYLGKGQIIQIDFQKDYAMEENFQKWYMDINMYEDIDDDKAKSQYRISKANLLKSLGSKVYKSISIPISNSDSGHLFEKSDIIVPLKKIVVKDPKTGKITWSYYLFVEINEDGQVIDVDGNVADPVTKEHFYKISSKDYNNAIERSNIEDLVKNLKSIPKLGHMPENKCISNPKKSNNKKNNQKNKSQFSNSKKPIGLLLKKRKEYIKHIRNHCLKNKKSKACKSAKAVCRNKIKIVTDEYTQKNIEWRNAKSLKDKSILIYKLAKKVYNEVQKKKIASSRHKKKRSRNFANTYRPDYIDKLITPELMSCVAYQETQGRLNPFLVNYHYCSENKVMPSSAFGLGQILRSTMGRLMRSRPWSDRPRVNLYPFNTKYSMKYRGLNYKQIYSKSSLDPDYQMELLFRTLNYSVKQKRYEYSKSSEGKVLLQGILLYDKDNASKYRENVINRCLSCMKKVKNDSGAWVCYQKLK